MESAHWKRDIDYSGNSGIESMVVLNDHLIFRANHATEGSEIWISDGTASGTNMIKNINPSSSSAPSSLTVMGNRVFFKANDGTNGAELWSTDGTESSTVRIGDVVYEISSG